MLLSSFQFENVFPSGENVSLALEMSTQTPLHIWILNKKKIEKIFRFLKYFQWQVLANNQKHSQFSYIHCLYFMIWCVR